MKFWISSFFTASVVMIFRSASCPGASAVSARPPASLVSPPRAGGPAGGLVGMAELRDDLARVSTARV